MVNVWNCIAQTIGRCKDVEATTLDTTVLILSSWLQDFILKKNHGNVIVVFITGQLNSKCRIKSGCCFPGQRLIGLEETSAIPPTPSITNGKSQARKKLAAEPVEDDPPDFLCIPLPHVAFSFSFAALGLLVFILWHFKSNYKIRFEDFLCFQGMCTYLQSKPGCSYLTLPPKDFQQIRYCIGLMRVTKNNQYKSILATNLQWADMALCILIWG